MTTKTCAGASNPKVVPSPRRRQPAPPAGKGLTARERELIALVAQGLQNKVIAHEMGISQNTVRAHVGNVMRKYGLRNRVQVAMLLMPMVGPGMGWPHRVPHA